MAQSFKPIDTESVLVSGQVDSQPTKVFFDRHLINMEFEELKDMNLYKFYSMKGLTPLLQQKRLFIDRVKSWEDNYENFFLKEKFYSKSAGVEINTDDVAHAFFGQCWTYAPETDAMWRIYSTDKHGVRIRTKVGKLFSTIFVDDMCIADTWLGKVEYSPMTQINSYIKQQTQVDSYSIWQSLMPYTQFIKRTEFEHEKEFRIVKMLDSDTCERYYDYKRLAFDITVSDFIEEILLDPRLDEAEVEAQKQEFVRLGVPESKISQSQLYHFVPITITLD